MNSQVSLYAIALTMLAGTAVPANAQAQTPQASGTEPQADTANDETSQDRQGGVEDIVVTAQRRSERMQDVPISVTTLTSRELASAGVAKTDALIQVTPGLVINRQLTGAVPYLRGVGSQNTSPGVESAIATYIDGVYYASAVGNIFSFNNIQQVEVLKGPQGTLFGRNATGGLISVTTREPSATSSIEGSIGYGNFNTLEGNFYATGGSDRIKADLAVYGVDQMDGFGRNVTTGKDVHVHQEISVRGKILWTPTDSDKITLSADYSHEKLDTGAVLTVQPGGVAADGTTYSGMPYNSRNNWPDLSRLTHWGASLKYQRDLGIGTFTSISAYRDLHSTLSLDQDGTPLPLVNVNLNERTRTFQQEALLVGQAPRFNWTAGVFLFFGNSGYFPLQVRSPIIPPLNFDTRTREHTESYAAYAQGTYAIGDATNLTVGARYTVDRREITGSQTASANGAVLATADASAKFPKLTYRFAIDHKLTPDTLIYASYSRGFKSGVFATGSVSNTAVRPETLDAIEGGIKTDLFDRVLRFNMSAFHYNYSDIQLNRIENGAGILLNAAKGRVYGGEIETTFAPRLATGSLQINANLSILDAKYTSFPNGPSFTVNPAGGNVQGVADLSGNRMIRSPKWTANVGFAYSTPLSAGTLELSANYYHTARFAWEPDGRLEQPAYSIVNAQIGFAFGQDERFRVRLWGKNLFDEVYYIYGIESVLGNLGNIAPPRTYGAAFDFKF